MKSSYRGSHWLVRASAMVLAAMLGLLQPICAYADGARPQHSAGAPRTLGGWSAAIVLTGSMQSVIPKDSLIITMPVAAEDLAVGDDIMFMTGPDTSITHRILSITEDFDGEGRRAFTTKGVDNAEPDASLVLEDNVVGKVAFSSHPVGAAIVFIRENWPICLFLVVLCAACVKVVRRINRPEPAAGRRIRASLDQKLPRLEAPEQQPSPAPTYGMKQPRTAPRYYAPGPQMA